MTKTICFALCLIMSCAAAALGADGKPRRKASPTTDAHRATVREGVALHERGDYDGAIAKYRSVLAESPDDVLPQYELAYTLMAKNDYQGVLEAARRGAEYDSPALGAFYVLIGTALDMLGESDDAKKAYENGIELAPDTASLYFNLAVTELKRKEADRARGHLKAAVALDPDLASGHYLLARAFYEGGYKVPALFAAARFLVLEPSSDRSAVAIEIVNEVLRGGLEKGADAHTFNLTLDLNGKKDEGDFDMLLTAIGLTSAVKTLPENGDKSEAGRLVEQWETVLELAASADDKKTKSSFAYRYYLPYFVGLKSNKLVEPFVYYTMQSSSVPGVGAWLHDNEARANDLRAWSEHFAWARDVRR